MARMAQLESCPYLACNRNKFSEIVDKSFSPLVYTVSFAIFA